MPGINTEHDDILQIISLMLRSDEVACAWEVFNKSKVGQNPGPGFAGEIESLKDTALDAQTHRGILSFMRWFVEGRIKALGKKQKREDYQARYDQLDKVAGTLRDILPDGQCIDAEKLSPERRDFLRTLDRYEVQRFKPLTDFKESAGHVFQHIWDVWKKQGLIAKGLSASLVFSSAILAAEGFVNKQNQTNTLERQETCYSDASADDIFGGDDYEVVIDKSSCNANYKSCHDNLKETFPTFVGILEKNDVKIMAFPHCTTVNNFAHNMQGGLLSAEEVLRNALFAVLSPVNDGLARANEVFFLEGSHAMNGANKFANPFQHALNGANRVENLFHLPLLVLFWCYAHAMATQARKKTPEEWQEFKDGWVDFINKARHARPLNYALPPAAVATYLLTHGYDTSGSLIDSNLVLLTLLGALSGQAAHKIQASMGRNKKHVMGVTEGAGDLLKMFNSKSLPLNEQQRMESQGKISKGTKRALWAGGGLAAYASILYADLSGFIDSLDEGPVKEFFIHTAEAAGALTVAVPSLGIAVPYNFLIEDPAQHLVFIGAGGTGGIGSGIIETGLAALGATLSVIYGMDIAKKLRHKTKAAFAAGVLSLTPASTAQTEDMQLYREEREALAAPALAAPDIH